MPDETAPRPPTAGQLAADAARTLPTVVADAFLACPVTVHGLTLQPFSWDTLLVLHRIGNSIVRKGVPQADASPGADEEKQLLETAQAIFAFCEPDRAIELASAPLVDGSWSDFDIAALAFMRARKILPWQVKDISDAVAKLITEGLAAAPGAGAANPPPPGTP